MSRLHAALHVHIHINASDDDVQGSVVLFPGQNLFVMSVMTSDAGLYECVAINAAGSDSVHFDLSVFGLFTRHQITHMYCPITLHESTYAFASFQSRQRSTLTSARSPTRR